MSVSGELNLQNPNSFAQKSNYSDTTNSPNWNNKYRAQYLNLTRVLIIVVLQIIMVGIVWFSIYSGPLLPSIMFIMLQASPALYISFIVDEVIEDALVKRRRGVNPVLNPKHTEIEMQKISQNVISSCDPAELKRPDDFLKNT